METCQRCGAVLEVGRFCLNCGQQVGAPIEQPDDFLPWLNEEVDYGDSTNLDNQDRSRAWLWWLIGAVATIAVVALGFWLLTAGENLPEAAPPPSVQPSSDPEPPSEPDPVTVPKPRPVNLAPTARAQAPQTAPPTQDLDGVTVSYVAAHMVDQLPTTAWRMAGDGSGTTLTFTLAADTETTAVGLINGYSKQVAGVAWYPNNRRVTSVTWLFDDGTAIDQTLVDSPRMQIMRIEPITTGSVRLRINAVTPPNAGPLGRDYTAISEVALIGRPTG